MSDGEVGMFNLLPAARFLWAFSSMFAPTTDTGSTWGRKSIASSVLVVSVNPREAFTKSKHENSVCIPFHSF